MIIYGASGHAKVIIDIIRSLDEETVDFIIDDDKSIKSLGGFEVLHEFTDVMDNNLVLIAVGNNSVRKKLVDSISYSYCKPLIHNSAIVSNTVILGEGSVIMPNATINSSAKIGKHCIINTGSIVEHDSNFEDFVHVSPGAVITGNVRIGEGTQIGAGATVIPGVNIGKWVTIGAGTVVIKDVPDYAVVVGSPGKIIKYNKVDNE